MISLSKTSSLSYYIENESDEVITNNAIDIMFCGSLAIELGIKAKMQIKDLENIFNGFDKVGKPLIKNAGIKNHTKGWDLTFSAPKPVSIIWARSSSDLQVSIREAHHFAVTESIKFLEEKAAYTRVKKDGKYRVPETVPILRSRVNLYILVVLVIADVSQTFSVFEDSFCHNSLR